MSQVEELEHEQSDYQMTEEEVLAEIESTEQSLDFAAPPMQPYWQTRLKQAYSELNEIRKREGNQQAKETKETKPMIQMTLTNEEKQILIECINQTIKTSPNAIQTAATLIPLVQKLQAKDEPTEA